MQHSSSNRPVFLDASGVRWHRVRRAAVALGAITTMLALALVVGVLVTPQLPGLEARTGTTLARLPRLAASRAERARLLARQRLLAAIATHGAARPAVRPSVLPVRSSRGARPQPRPRPPAVAPGRAIVAGFYVNWDDNSFVSLKAHASRLDWAVCEWIFLGTESAQNDTLRVRVDRRVLDLVQHMPAGHRPGVLAMISNFDSARATFDAGRLRRLVAFPRRRASAVAQITAVVRRYALAGVTIDLEEVPDDLHPYVLAFVRELGAALHPLGAVVTQAVSVDFEPERLQAYAAANDRLFLMLYDEHSRAHDAGPVASQPWYVEQAQRLLASVPPEKAILAVGAYGYDWNDAEPDAEGQERTFQDVMRAAREHHVPVHFDSTSLNPYVTWSDADSTDHAVWFLDAVTAYNQMSAARTLGAAGVAVWRLGSEDPSLWRVLGANGWPASPDSLRAIATPYDVEFVGAGELLRLDARPTIGRRDVRVDPTTHLAVGEALATYPTPYVVSRTGAVSHHVALTFDDGPDAKWTPMILDTLRSRHAPGTFFLIGENVEGNLALTRRIARDGHEIGNHTFTHPNLALTGAFVTRLELDATERIIEAVVDRRTRFFRPPYFGDAEPTTADELIPVGIATDLGYMTAGLHVDSDDWRQPGVESIIRSVLDGRDRALACADTLHRRRDVETPLERGCSGSVVLLHDGGGNRAQTVAALGVIIDSLRARGDTLVPLSTLAGVTREQAMPPLPASSAGVRFAELLTFGAIGLTEWALTWLFLLAVVLGTGRLVVVTVLALFQRYGTFRRRHAHAPAGWAPPVSVVVPAYNEGKVITMTIESLLAQDYAGDLEVVVVDDGSPDDTYEVARAAYGAHPRVSIHRKPNGGKASALNYGLARSHGEIVVGLDADTVFLRDTVTHLVAPLADPRVGAVAGNAKVGNRVNVVTRWQALEYITSQNVDRRAFSQLDCITVVPGAVGAWRKAVVLEAGGFSDDTLAEDQDLTLAIRRRGYSIAYADEAIAYTEAPDTLAGLSKQRFRWSFGTLQCMWKHRGALLRPRYGTLGMIAMPNVWLFQLLFTALSPLADLLLVWSLFSVWLVKVQHGATYALTNLQQVLTFYAVFLLVDWAAAMTAFLMERDEDRRLAWLVFTQRFVYRQLMYSVVVRSFVAAVRGRIVGWGKLERTATVEVPGARREGRRWWLPWRRGTT